MEITTDLVKHLMSLSRLNFNDEEIENFKEEFAKTLSQIDELQSVNTDDVETFNKIINAKNLRQDEVKPSLSVQEVIKNSEKSARGMVVVPRVVE